jgi:hypothetical protein
MPTIYTDIIDALIAAINSMTVVGGFNNDYTRCNDYNHDTMTYPNVKVLLPEEVAREAEGEVINSYTADSEITFEVTVDNTVSPVDKALDQVVEDFKRLLEEEHADLQIEGMIVADYIDSQREYTHVRARPGKVSIIFNINYRVLKSNPSSTT